MKRVAIAAVVVVVAAIAAWRWWPRETAHAPARDVAGAPAAHGGSSSTTTASPATGVRKLSEAERRELGDKIRAAIARTRAASTPGGASSSAGTAPQLAEEPTILLEQVSKELFQGLQDALPLVAECYKPFGSAKQAMARMTMVKIGQG